MSDTVNLFAESDRNIIGDDSSPTLTLENSSSGNVVKLQNAGGTGVQLSAVSCPTTSVYVTSAAGGIHSQTVGTAGLFKSTATEGLCLDAARTVCGSATVAILRLTNNSTASGPLLDFGRVDFGVVSTASACATIDFAVRVKVGNSYGWIPIYRAVA